MIFSLLFFFLIFSFGILEKAPNLFLLLLRFSQISVENLGPYGRFVKLYIFHSGIRYCTHKRFPMNEKANGGGDCKAEMGSCRLTLVPLLYSSSVTSTGEKLRGLLPSNIKSNPWNSICWLNWSEIWNQIKLNQNINSYIHPLSQEKLRPPTSEYQIQSMKLNLLMEL